MTNPDSHYTKADVLRLFSELRVALDDTRLMEYDPDDELYMAINRCEDMAVERQPADDRRSQTADLDALFALFNSDRKDT